MPGVRPVRNYASIFVGAAALLASTMLAGAQERVMTITATEPMTTDNPYGDSSAPVYSLWCHTYGCLGRYDYTAEQARRHTRRKMGSDRSAHMAVHPAARSQAPRWRSRSHIGGCRAHAQAHPHRSRKRSLVVRRNGDRDRAGRRVHVRHQDEGAGRQSHPGAVRPLHHHVRRPLCKARARGGQEVRGGLGALQARGISGRPPRGDAQEQGLEGSRRNDAEGIPRRRHPAADARARTARDGAAERRSAGGAPHSRRSLCAASKGART